VTYVPATYVPSTVLSEYTSYMVVVSRAGFSEYQRYIPFDSISTGGSSPINLAQKVMWSRFHDIRDFRVCALHNYMYVIGGKREKLPPRSPNRAKERRNQSAEKTAGGSKVPPEWKRLKQFLRYDPRDGRWKDLADMAHSRAGHTATAFKDHIIVTG